MAGTGAIPQLADGVIDRRVIYLLVLILPVVSCVATCTIWLVGAVEPGHGLAVTLVTIYARDVGSMVAWIVGRLVPKGEERRPAVGAMARIALH